MSRNTKVVVGSVVTLALAFFAYAVATHGEYISRAQVSEAVRLLDWARTPVTEYFAKFKKWPDSIEQATGGNVRGTNVQSVVISRGAGGMGDVELKATMYWEPIVNGRVAGKTIQVSSSDQGKSWVCRSANIPDEYLPEKCRHSAGVGKKPTIRR